MAKFKDLEVENITLEAVPPEEKELADNRFYLGRAGGVRTGTAVRRADCIRTYIQRVFSCNGHRLRH